MRIQILVENYVKKRGLAAEHGLSVFIEHENVKVLFDTGQSELYCRNAENMGIDLSQTDCIVLSHGHYDHCGGLLHFPQRSPFPPIYAHPCAFEPKFASEADGRSFRSIGIPWSLHSYPDIQSSLVFTSKRTSIGNGMTLFAEIPSTTAFEEIPTGFYTGDDRGKSRDMFPDEQMLVYDGIDGLVLFLGCSHPGVINCITHAMRQYPGKIINTVLAGMHLENVSPLRLQMTMQSFLDLDIRKIIPLHCTGLHALEEMKRFLGARCIPLHVGDTLEI